MLSLSGIIKIVKGDITKCSTDVIVNSANPTLLGGGGVDGAIHRAAGPELLEETKKLGGCKRGEAKITKGYRLKAKFIIHTVGPIWQGGDKGEEKILKSCYINSLKLAKKYNLARIAFPSISTGVYGYPIEKASLVALRAVKEFLEKEDFFKEIVFVLFSDKDFAVYKKSFEQVFGAENA